MAHVRHCARPHSTTSNTAQDHPDVKTITNLAWKIIPFSAIPEWMRDNEYIETSYRPPMFSFRGCFKSMFRMHNETWNIWTHFLGFLFFVILVAGIFVFGDYITGLFEDVTISKLPWREQAILSLFFGGAMACLLCSSLFHIMHNHSKDVGLIFCRLDYSGIAFLITGSCVPAYYYGFYCTSIARTIHISIVLILCVVCIAICFKNEFYAPKYRVFRYILFVLFGLYSVIPFFHIFIREGYAVSTQAYGLWGIVAVGAFNIGGGALYAMRIPERFKPGMFDVWASSHQLFHICVVTGALVHYDALLTMIKYRLDVGRCVDE